jgi:hypothetical protein
MPSTNYISNQNHFVKVERSSTIETLNSPVPLGPSLLRKENTPNQGDQYERARTRLNIDRIHRDRN